MCKAYPAPIRGVKITPSYGVATGGVAGGGVASVGEEGLDGLIVPPGAVGCPGVAGNGCVTGGASAAMEGLGYWNTQS